MYAADLLTPIAMIVPPSTLVGVDVIARFTTGDLPAVAIHTETVFATLALTDRIIIPTVTFHTCTSTQHNSGVQLSQHESEICESELNSHLATSLHASSLIIDPQPVW